MTRMASAFVPFLVLLALVAGCSADPLTPAERARSWVRIDVNITLLRLAVATAGVLLLGYAQHLVRRGRPRHRLRERRIALGCLAALAFGAGQNFFVWSRELGFHIHDVYHYYLGAKYFPELGYHDLYRCSLAALSAGTGPRGHRYRVRLCTVPSNQLSSPSRFGDIPKGVDVDQDDLLAVGGDEAIPLQ